jgi:hypothetical protein
MEGKLDDARHRRAVHGQPIEAHRRRGDDTWQDGLAVRDLGRQPGGPLRALETKLVRFRVAQADAIQER